MLLWYSIKLFCGVYFFNVYLLYLNRQVKELESNAVTMDNVLRSVRVNADRADKDLTKSEDRLNEKKKQLKEVS